MTIDPTSLSLVHTVPGSADVLVERDHVYPTASGPLPFDLYRPPHATAPCPAVVLVTGYPDPGVAAMFGKPFKDWAAYRDWGRALAAAGLIAIVYANREPADVTALFHHLRTAAPALGIDATRLGVWSTSGNVPTALAVVAHERPAAAALLYGFMLDLDGGTEVATAAAQIYFAAPPVTLDELPATMPMLVVRAGGDTTPGLNATIERFVGAARARAWPVTLVDVAEAPHAFDLMTDTAAAHAAVEQVLGFLRQTLSSAPAGR